MGGGGGGRRVGGEAAKSGLTGFVKLNLGRGEQRPSFAGIVLFVDNTHCLLGGWVGAWVGGGGVEERRRGGGEVVMR